jgi:hypothetical protein
MALKLVDKIILAKTAKIKCVQKWGRGGGF